MTELIDAFNKIRTIPYKIVDTEYSLDNSYALIHSKGASCTPKHIVLDDIIKSLGFETRYCVHEFHWSSFKLKFPKEITDLLNPSFFDFHTNLEVKIDNDWIRVDATWDDKLIDAGFPGTKIWDGKLSTINGVISIKEFKFDTLEKRNSFLLERSKNIKFANEFEFISKLNDYLGNLRMNT